MSPVLCYPSLITHFTRVPRLFVRTQETLSLPNPASRRRAVKLEPCYCSISCQTKLQPHRALTFGLIKAVLLSSRFLAK